MPTSTGAFLLLALAVATDRKPAISVLPSTVDSQTCGQATVWLTYRVDANVGDKRARVVTVSATYGACGSVIAPALASRLGLPFADRLIPARNAPATPSSERVTDAEREQEPRRSFFSRLAALNAGLNFPLPRDPAVLRADIRQRVEASIAELLQGGGGVILGRAAAVVLAGCRSVYHVRLDGPEERRVRRAILLEGIDESAARARMAETDQARIRYVRRLYERDPADPTLYHLILDSTVLDIEPCVGLIADAATAFWSGGSGDIEQMTSRSRSNGATPPAK
jgi:cytidylate kinase